VAAIGLRQALLFGRGRSGRVHAVLSVPVGVMHCGWIVGRLGFWRNISCECERGDFANIKNSLIRLD
jgi:hypothetical protein